MTESASPMLRPSEDLTRPEQHLYLLLQRFSYCLDRYRARFPEPGEDLPPGGERQARIDAITREIATLDFFAREAFADRTLPLMRLRERFGLDEVSVNVLVAAAAPALDLSLARRVYAFCGRAQPEAGFLVDALAANLSDERACLQALRSTAPMVRHRLLKLGDSTDWVRETPPLHARLVVPERILDWLRGDVGFEGERFERTAVFRVPPPAARPSMATLRSVAAMLLREHEGRPAPLVVAGPALAGKATAIVDASWARGIPVLDVDLEKVAETSRPPELLRDLAREAMLRGALFLLRHGEALDDSTELRRAVIAVLDAGALHSAVTVRGEWSDALRKLPGAQMVRVDVPGDDEQLALWERALPESVPQAPDVDLAAIVQRYRLSPGDILEAGANARDLALARGGTSAVAFEDIVASVRGRLRHRLRDVAEVMSTTLTWDDVVLPPPVMDRIVELVATINFRSQVMEGWGFARKVTYGRAVSALFSGPPGTGKTMVATLIAKELGLEIFRVDLSRVVSKWVGETEKNLGRAFDEARQSQAVLLFDEADALFARRTDVKSSNDRYANLEVNYLLQRLESFDGIVLLTTNNQSSIDDAFRRRLRFRIEFPVPEGAERAELWRALIPDGAPLAADVDFHELGREFEMSGGHIKNAVVRAAFLAAASEGGEPLITHDVLVRAGRLEWEEMGRLAKAT